MENSILNIAHEKQRKVEVFLHQGRFEEAAECHEKVAGLLSEVHNQFGSNIADTNNSTLPTKNFCNKSTIPLINSIVALESLALQRDYHKRQAAVVRMKQAQYEEYKNTLEVQQKNLISKHSGKHHEKGPIVPEESDKFDGSLRQAIYKTIEEQDSLLCLISLPDDDQAFKHPKDTGTVIEELRTVNSQLRSLVESLLSQLETKEQEVKQLTQQLHTVSVVGNDEICTGEGRSVRLAPLPPLAPLEMPLFDYTSS